MKLIGKKDIVIIGAALAVCLVAALLFAGSAGGEVRVYVGEELYEEASLYMDKTIVIDQHNGSRNEVRIENGGVYMAFSTCENQNCVHQGEMTPDNIASRALSNWIICLPNRVTVELAEE
ncbi:MAG: NusG domain II-containing protein [Clostridia bacterium]|nr:NusG domain II-containing protein [Clostridia bacterium]